MPFKHSSIYPLLVENVGASLNCWLMADVNAVWCQRIELNIVTKLDASFQNVGTKFHKPVVEIDTIAPHILASKRDFFELFWN